MTVKTEIDGIIEEFGTDVTVITNVIKSNLDEWGEPVIASSTTRDIKAVKDRDMVKQFTLQSTGRVNAPSASLIVKAEEVFNTRTDKIEYNGQVYNILAVQELELSNELLAQIVDISLA